MTQDAELPLDRKPDPAAPPRSLLLIAMAGIVSVLLWLAVVGQFVFMVPRFERILAEFHMKPPLLTEWVIRDSRWAVPAITLAAFLVCIGLGRRSRWPWLFLLIALPFILNVLVCVSIYVPSMELLEGLIAGLKA